MSRPQILIIDDNKEIRDVLVDTLTFDYDLQQAENGEEAIEILTNIGDDIDLIILDVQMPVTDGWETLRIIKDEENGWPDIPVCMLTVRKEPESVLKAWEIGAQDYIPKPFSPTQLLEAVHRRLELSRNSIDQ